MAYTVKKLAQLSGVSERTLRWYDTIGLLSPAYYGNNGYRYYEEEQLLMLQQILFFRELDLPLDEIRRIVTGSDFDKVRALNVHRQTLQRNLERARALIKTIDKTVLHIRGKKPMEDKELYKGFYEFSEGKGNESYYIGQLTGSDDSALRLVVASAIKPKQAHEKSLYEELDRTVKDLYQQIAACLDEGLKPTSKQVQGLIKQHHTFILTFHDATRDVYKAMAKVYREYPDFRKQIDPTHPQLADFMADAMVVFADKNLE